MSGAVSDALARFRLWSHKFSSGRLFNGSGNAGPRRLAVIGLVMATMVVVVVMVALGGRHAPPSVAGCPAQGRGPASRRALQHARSRTRWPWPPRTSRPWAH